MRHPNSRRHVALIALLAGAVALAGCAGTAQTVTETPTVATTATPKTAACVGTYTSANAANRFSIACPAGWVVQPAASLPNGVVFLTHDQTAGFVVSRENTSVAASQYSNYLKSYLGKVGAKNITVSANHQPMTVGANNWTVTTATFTKDGTNYTINQYAMEHNGYPVFVEFLAPTASYATVQPQFHTSLATLHFM